MKREYKLITKPGSQEIVLKSSNVKAELECQRTTKEQQFKNKKEQC